MVQDSGWTSGGSETQHTRVTVTEAAEILGTTAEAVRTRIKRGKLDAEKIPDQPGGTVYVLLEVDQSRPNTYPTSEGQGRTPDQTVLIDELQDRVRFLERELERRAEEAERYQHIVAGLSRANAELSSTVRALEEGPPSDQAWPEGPLESPEGVVEDEQTDVPSEARATSERPWWRRIFGG